MRPRFLSSFGAKINTHATTAGNTAHYVIGVQNYEVQAVRAMGVHRRKNSCGHRNVRRPLGEAWLQPRLVAMGETGSVGSSGRF